VKRLLAIVFAAVLVTGCGPANLLGGSTSEVIALDVSRVEIRRNGEALQISYYRNRGVFLDMVIQVAVALKDVDVQPGVTIDLAGEYEPGHPRTTVIHAPGGEPVRVFPRVHRGDMHISSGGNPDEVTKGNFSMLFENEGGDLGFGRTLTGDFSAMTQDGGFGDPVPDGGVP